MAGTRWDRYFYAGMTFILGLLAIVLGVGLFLFGRTSVGEALIVVGIVAAVAGFAGARMGGKPKTPA